MWNEDNKNYVKKLVRLLKFVCLQKPNKHKRELLASNVEGIGGRKSCTRGKNWVE